MQLSRFICLSCLDTDTVVTNGFQRGYSQGEFGHIKDVVCIKYGDVKVFLQLLKSFAFHYLCLLQSTKIDAVTLVTTPIYKNYVPTNLIFQQ